MAEIREKINEIMEDMGGRIRNPLILSFILVWLYFHWQLIYLVLTMDSTLPVASRLGSVKIYINEHNNWCGMIGIPLLWSFVSLCLYYLIAIAGQAIRILFGKRFNAFMLYKIDKGAFALKTELDLERKKNNKLQNELNKVKDSSNSLVTENSDLENENGQLSSELNKISGEYERAKTHVYNNEKFIERHQNTLVALLARSKQVKDVAIPRAEVLRNHFSVINGNWNGLYGNFLPQNSGNALNLIIDHESVLDYQGQEVGTMEDFSFEKSLNLVEFKLKKTKDNIVSVDQFYLIIINRDEMIGLYNKDFVSLKREK